MKQRFFLLYILASLCLAGYSAIGQALPAGIYKFYPKEMGEQAAGFQIIRPDSSSHYWSEDTPNILQERATITYAGDLVIFNTSIIMVGNADGVQVYEDVVQKFRVVARHAPGFVEVIKVEEIDDGVVTTMDDPRVFVFRQICETY